MLIFHGMLRSSNFGDVLMAQISLKWLREMTDMPIKAVFVVQELRELLDLPTATLIDLVRAQVAILSGGGYFQIADNGIPPIKRFIKNAGPLLIAQLANRPTVILGVGVGSVPSGLLKYGVKCLFSMCERSCVRDRTSFELIQHIAPQAMVTQTADLVFTLHVDQIPFSAFTVADRAVDWSSNQRKVGILLSNTPDSDVRYAAVFEAIIEAAKKASDIHFLLLEDHVGLGSGQQRCQAQLYDQFDTGKATILSYPGTFELTAMLSRMDSVLTDKLHVGLVAAAMGVEPFSIAKHPKNIAAYADIGLSKNCLLLDTADSVQCNSLVDSAFQASKPFVVPPDVREAAMNNRECLYDFLAEHHLLKRTS